MGVDLKTAIDSSQIKKIHALKNVMNMPDEEYRRLIHLNFYPATSSKHLSYEQAEVFINGLEEKAIKKGVWEKFDNRKYNNLGYREDMATPNQLRLIEGLWKNISVIKEPKNRHKALRAWLYKRFKVSDLRFLDHVTVSKVIYALNMMQKKKPKNRRKPQKKKKDAPGYESGHKNQN